MIIKGFQGTSLIDYPGNVASIIFTAKCNFRCRYCYNQGLVMNSSELPEIKPEKILSELLRRKKFIDGLVVTGGEPTLHSDLPFFLKKVKDIGLKVKLDTNGTNPDMIAGLIKKGLVDYISMDVKAPLGKYEDVVGLKADTEAITESISIIKKSNIEYEFRTTVLPCLLSKQDLHKIGELLKGSKKYCLQQFKSMPGVMDESLKNKPPYTREELEELKKELAEYYDEIEVRT